MAKKVTKKDEINLDIQRVETPKEEASKREVLKGRDKVNAIRVAMLEAFGNNAVMTGKDLEQCDFGRLSTGSISLDIDLGGGLPVGKATQLSGIKSGGKSTLCDKIIREALDKSVEWSWNERIVEKKREIVVPHELRHEGFSIAYLDAEGTKDFKWSEVLGARPEEWIYSQPTGAEEALEMAVKLQEAGVNLIVIDSIDALIPLKVAEAEMGESVQMGIKAKMLGDYLRKYTTINNRLIRDGKLPCTLILVNQIREKIGVMHGNPEFTPGGKALEFYCSVEVRVRRGDWLAEGTGNDKQFVGQQIKYKTEKNKTYKPNQSGSFNFYFEDSDDTPNIKGDIDNFSSIILEGAKWGAIEKAGSWLKYKGENLAQGFDKTVKLLREDTEKFEAIKKDLFEIIKA